MLRCPRHGARSHVHRRWVAHAFGPLLPSGRGREEAVDLLVVATDVYTWKLLRRDRRLSVRQTCERMESLVRAVLALHEPGSA